MTINKTILAASMAVFGLLGQPVLSHADAMLTHTDAYVRPAMQNPDFERMARLLGISFEQRLALKVIVDKYRPELRELAQLSFDNRKALSEMDASDPGLQELAAAQGKTMADMTVLLKQMSSQMDKVLTPAQQQRMEDLFGQRQQHADKGYD
jgi:Spy/CpxP family protein refolding chaperone